MHRWMLGLALLGSAVVSAEDEPELVPHIELKTRNRPYPVYPREAYALSGSRCLAEVTIDAGGRPVAVEVDASCPPVLARPTQIGLLRWRWAPPGRTVRTQIGVTYRVSGGAEVASTGYFGHVAEAYSEIPDDEAGCVVSVDLHPTGLLSRFTSNAISRCMAVPAGDPTPSADLLAITTAPVVCTFRLEATPAQVYALEFEDDCPAAHQQHIRAMIMGWTWRTDPTTKTTPYQVTIRFAPARSE